MTKISELAAASAVAGTEYVPIVQTGSTRRASLLELGRSVPRTITGSYTLTAADEGAFLRFTSDSPWTLTVPTNASVALPVGGVPIRFVQAGAGQGTVVSAGAAVSVVSARSGAPTTRNTTTGVAAYGVLMPPAVVTGDGILVVLTTASDNVTAWAPPSSDWVQVGTVNGPSGARDYVFRRANAPSSLAGTTQTFTATDIISQFPALSAVAVAFAGAHQTDFIDGHAQTGTSAITQLTPSLTTSNAGCLEVGIVSGGSGNTPEEAVTYIGSSLVSITQAVTNAAGGNNRTSIARGADGPRPAETAIGGRQSWSASGGYGGARTIAVRPAATAGSVALRSVADTVRTGARWADNYLTKLAADEWLLTGLFT